MDWCNKLKEKRLSTGIPTLPPFIPAKSVHAAVERDKNTHDFDFRDGSSSPLPKRKIMKEQRDLYASVFWMQWFKCFFFIWSFHASALSVITILIPYSLVHYFLERFLYSTFHFLTLKSEKKKIQCLLDHCLSLTRTNTKQCHKTCIGRFWLVIKRVQPQSRIADLVVQGYLIDIGSSSACHDFCLGSSLHQVHQNGLLMLQELCRWVLKFVKNN